MRLTFYAVLLTVIQSWALDGYAQTTRLDLEMKNSTVREVLAEIEDMSRFRFLYNSKMVDVEREVSISIKNKTIEKVLEKLFDDKDVEYTIVDRQIVLFAKGSSVSNSDFIQQQRQVSGTVTDDAGDPLPGVTVVVKGTTIGTVSNANGNYTIAPPENARTLIFSFIGMRTQEIEIGGRNTIDVTMNPDMIGIEEVVAIGYGVTKKSDLTGAVSSVDAEDIENIPVSRVDQILQGKAAGVQVTQVNGAPGSGSSIRIRGGNSIQGDNEPLYVIDGFIVGTGFNLNNINVNDIESIEVLKDAASISIYGTRGANGVILITTKSGL
ncbi:MAG TPA: TonB-dependent receptor plug domain-containing protein, partial [Tangfeifania sp.]|nr:TonB-dependent receptor plug domain-containing protein [Tangfeifania sp.]